MTRIRYPRPAPKPRPKRPKYIKVIDKNSETMKDFFINNSNRKGKYKIQNALAFESIADDILTDFVEKLKEPYVEKLTDESKDEFPEGAEWLFTYKGAKIYKRYQERLRKLGNHYFGTDEMFFIRVCASCVSDF